MKWRKQNGSVLVCPADKGWETWRFPMVGAPQLESRAEGDVPTPVFDSATVALPARQVMVASLWLATTDGSLFADMIFTQLERRGLLVRSREETVMDYSVIAKEEGRTLVLVGVLPVNFPEKLCMRAARFDFSPRLFPMPANRAVFWREGGRLVMSVTRGEALVHVQTLGGAELNAPLAEEARRALWQLEAQGVVMAIEGVTLWGTIPGVGSDEFGKMLKLPVVQSEKPFPKIPDRPWNLLPRPVAIGRVIHEGVSRKRQLVALAALFYLVFVAWFAGRAGWFYFQKTRLARSIEADAATVLVLSDAAARWKALEPAVNIEFYPMEQLFKCTQVLPPEGVRFTLFEQRGGKLLIMGEAKNSPAAFKFTEDVQKSKSFAFYRWQVPQPKLLANGSAQFQMEGARPNATDD